MSDARHELRKVLSDPVLLRELLGALTAEELSAIALQADGLWREKLGRPTAEAESAKLLERMTRVCERFAGPGDGIHFPVDVDVNVTVDGQPAPADVAREVARALHEARQRRD